MTNDKKVLLTGITGFVASHTAIQLLEKGYHVTGTLRDMKRAASIKSIIAKHTSAINNLAFAEADIEDATVWKSLMKDVHYVQHIASPFPKTMPKDENELIVPARNGNINILSAAVECRIKRVVIISSGAAVYYGQPMEKRIGVFNENNWSDENRKDDITPYYKSKTIAEKAAWEFIKKDSTGLELAVVCPSLVLGPLLEEDFSASANVIIKLMNRAMPAIPQIGFEIVDVHSIASLLILAMEKPEAANQRYIGSSGYLNFTDIAQILKNAYPEMKIPSGKLPNWLAHIFSLFDGTLKPILLDLGTERKLNHSKAIKELGWKPIDVKEAVLSSAKSILELGLVKQK